ncbi:MAG TPA: hypothetical protein VFO46_04680 [Candidatus Sulfotelmatobacter sp.]|nr:hypothetical protein [Candidatus Sulfotelmatobacter sp.]
MTKSNVHAILGELHKLLATYKQADFVEASKYSGVSRAMKVALRTLAREAESTQDGSERALRRSGAGTLRGRSQGASSEKNQLLSLLRRAPFFESTTTLARYAESLGLRLMPRPKDSRERLAIKIVNFIAELPETKKSEIFNELLRGRNSQTQGWIEVIKER